MSAFSQVFPSHFVKRILNWKQGDEDDTWSGKAFDALVKKLRRQPIDQSGLLFEVLKSKNENTPCITLSRSQDGRLQVSHRKMLPHVMYCRIFRWPDLQSQHELKSVATCQYPAIKREQSKICVNPYHYARVEHSVYPPVVTPRNNEFTNASPPPESPLSPGSNYIGSPNYNENPHLTPIPSQQHVFNSSLPAPLLHQQENPNSPSSYLRTNHSHQQLQTQNSSFNNYYQSSQSPVSESNWYAGANGGAGPSVSHESPRHNLASYLGDLQSSPPPAYARNDQKTAPLVPMDMSSDDSSQQTNSTFTGSDENSWCRITYAELNQKIGEPFKGSSPQVIVDGFTDPSVHNRRFSLGVLSNINRNSTIEMTRRAIRNGICLENKENQIYVKNLSESSIFFHSKNCNVENQLNQHTVVKIEPQQGHKLFDQKVFENLVQEAIRSTDGKTYERLYSLIEHCTIKMSFVKGWGSLYQRQDVTSTPCWIEIHLSKPMALIDQYLRQTGPPSCQITSTS